MPSRLRPTAPFAAEAILVGDPGRALLLAQELLERPKMCNHARGLWGYSGRTAGGHELTIQAAGMGGPSAALVLGDMAKLGVESVVRVGTCAGLAGRGEPGELLVVGGALAVAGSATSFGLDLGDTATPDPELRAALESALGGEGRTAIVASLDVAAAEASELPDSVAAADMQTAAVFGRAAQLGMSAAAVLVVDETDGERIGGEKLETAAKLAGKAATAALCRSDLPLPNPQVEG